MNPEILESCYRAGAFPMADRYGGVQFYRSDPRAVLELDSLHVSKSLARVVRKGVYEVRVDRDFERVIRACARRPETWISEEIIRGFVALHESGKAHSVEAYRGDELMGGLYGVTLGGAFMGESMFSRMSDASKVCFVYMSSASKSGGTCCSIARSKTTTSRLWVPSRSPNASTWHAWRRR
ncbi:Leucyl/phenylalanyl-tRNA--protein transferase [uncultured Rubrobacteraceae bacterium]|uniref:Leucyl/phenylalanyl-tRNA--protein transferase n=1 Tax=uncultured Rubrobacteraceae bacterium TaxID=349277 RepID=A0A6J4PUB3_9ACTN|nr:Leucyl/phenylalanyl-tRNA--protein transferase [uncultured Rubrobacteraceae bacterium]